MKYQIQKVNKSNQAEREVLAEKGELMNSQEMNAWYAEATKDVQVPETHQLYPVPENHPWFKVDESVSVGTSTTDTSRQSTNQDEIPADDPPSFAEVAQAELARNAKKRKEDYEGQQKLNAALRSLSK